MTKLRGLRRIRCAGCGLTYVCLCDTERVPSPVEFWILRHMREVRKPTNTGKIIGHCLDNTRNFVWNGARDETLHELLVDNRFFPMVAFPNGKPVSEIREQYGSDFGGRKPACLLLDGTWKQARKIYRSIPALHALPLVSIEQRISGYRLRNQHQAGNLATVEVAIALLEDLGASETARYVLQTFTRFHEIYQALRASRSREFVSAMLPSVSNF